MLNEDLLISLGAVYKKIKKGEFIFHEGAICYYYFQLVKGSVSWVNYDVDGKEYIQYMIEEGEAFGEMPLFDNLPYAANAIAELDSIIIQLPKVTFLTLLKDNTELLLDFSKLLSERVRYKFSMLKDLASHNPEQQILSLFSYFKQKQGESKDSLFKINFTRQQLAGMTGLRVETVIRVIKKLEEKGKLKINKGKVFIVNCDFTYPNLAL